MHFARSRLELRLPGTLLGECAAAAKAAFPYETGGVLLGHRTDRQCTVVEVVGPGPRATHGPTTFDPDQEWQEAEVARLWTAHGGNVNYLGDWHSHPNGPPVPSERDRTVLRLIATDVGARCPAPVMLIIAIRRSRIRRPRAYQLVDGDAKAIRHVATS